jgi:hypothetical protein
MVLIIHPMQLFSRGAYKELLFYSVTCGNA